MSNIKCPFCQQELEIWHTNRVRMYACPDLTCKGYYMSATKDMWQELIRTRKALDVALDKLKRIQKIYTNAPFNAPINYANVCTDMYDVATEQITALEQKDVK